ncbi:hypothetical protein [Streptomyces buecherae]|uniref:hypothetical protein n=1 Tax=Streptomyces buecherae TaxID=2763006 RepID=UPI00379FC823
MRVQRSVRMSVRRHRCGGGAVAVVAGGLVVTLVATAGCSSRADPEEAGEGLAQERVADEWDIDSGPSGAPGADPTVSAEPAEREVGAAPAVLREAAGALARAGSARVRTSVETAAGATRVAIQGSGGYDFVERMGRLRVRLPKDAVGDDEHEPITELLAPAELFLFNRGAGVPDDRWVRVDSTRVADGNLVTGGATDPLVAAQLLRGARQVSVVGRGEPARGGLRHYRGVADLDAAARAAEPYARGVLRAAARGFATDAVRFDAFLDAQGRLRKIRHRFTMTNAAGGQRRETDVVSTTELYAFGAAVALRPPKPADIYAGTVDSPKN